MASFSSSLRGGRSRKFKSDINVVPYIDVMLVLLIIFMVTAPLISPSVIDLPSVGRAARQPDQVVQIVIGKDELLDMKIKDKTTRLQLRDVAAAVKSAQASASNPAVVRKTWSERAGLLRRNRSDSLARIDR